jgi:biopolymer transport protein ExbD
MADMETSRSTANRKKSYKKSTRVDLTPMVDLGFLLISFFVFTTTLTTQTAMKVIMPYDKTSYNDPVCESCVLTVMLEGNNKIRYYEGAAEHNPAVKETGYSANEIRNVLLNKKAAVQKIRNNSEAFILIIKPSKSSIFKNFVDITDEVTICQIKRYYIDEIRAADERLLLH